MTEVRREPLDVFELDRHEIVGGVGHPRFIARAVRDAASHADLANGGNLGQRSFERGNQLFAIGRRQVWTRLHQDEMRHHVEPLAPVSRIRLTGAWLGRRLRRRLAPRLRLGLLRRPAFGGRSAATWRVGRSRGPAAAWRRAGSRQGGAPGERRAVCRATVGIPRTRNR